MFASHLTPPLDPNLQSKCLICNNFFFFFNLRNPVICQGILKSKVAQRAAEEEGLVCGSAAIHPLGCPGLRVAGCHCFPRQVGGDFWRHLLFPFSPRQFETAFALGIWTQLTLPLIDLGQ